MSQRGDIQRIPESVALMFPGQGSQFVGMAADLLRESALARQILERADECLGYSLTKIMAGEPPGELNSTRHTQPAIFVHSIALFEEFRSRYTFSTIAAAGHSLGEYSALYAAGVFDFETALELVKVRSIGMERAQPDDSCAMAAIMGMSKEGVMELIEKCRGDDVLEVANFNSPDQVVVSGHTPAVERAVKAASHERGSRAIRLNVSSAFHTRLMQPSLEGLEKQMELSTLGSARFPVIANVDALAYPQEDDGIRRRLLKQIVSPVRWDDCVREMLKRGASAFLEIGPGKVLTGLLRRIDRNALVVNINTLESVLLWGENGR